MTEPWTWSFETSPSAPFVMTNYDCPRTWMMTQMGHWTGHVDAGPSASFLTTNYECFRNRMMGHWTWRFEAVHQLHS